ncbi:MAG: hypothetical protein ABFD96_01985, partial [Armatimonadia bacterium]
PGSQSQVNIGAQAVNVYGEGLIVSPDAVLNLYGTVHKSVASAFHATKTTVTAVAGSTWVAIAFDTVYVDTGGSLLWRNTTPVFTGAGLNDMTRGATNGGSPMAPLNYVVEIYGSATQFRWSDDGGSTWDGTGVTITGAEQQLGTGPYIVFAATTGHTVGDRWAWTEYPRSRVYAVEDGQYAVAGGIYWGSPGGTAAKKRWGAIYKGGTGGVCYAEHVIQVAAVTCTLNPSAQVDMLAGEYVEVYARHDDAASLDLGAATSAARQYQSIQVSRIV